MYDIYLSYSGRKTYLTCPKQYWFHYIVKDPSRGDKRKSMFGSAIGKLFEWFYEDKMWAEPNPEIAVLSRVKEAISFTFSNEKYSVGLDPSFESSLLEDMQHFAPIGVKIIRENGFLTPYSRAEVDLTVTYSPPDSNITIKMGGRADFIHGKNLTDIWIIDGKASKHREKYVDSDQLIWYATQHYLKYSVAPTKLGFLFWCYPDKPLSWVAYDSDSMRNLVKKTTEISKRILSKDFRATPSGECHRCPFKSKCDDGQIHLAKRRVETGGRIDENFFLIEKV